MASVRDIDGPVGGNLGTTLIGVGAMLGVIYLGDRIYRKWLRENEPFAEHRARMRRLSAGYKRKRASVKEVVGVLADVLVEVARATELADRPTIIGRDD